MDCTRLNQFLVVVLIVTLSYGALTQFGGAFRAMFQHGNERVVKAEDYQKFPSCGDTVEMKMGGSF